MNPAPRKPALGRGLSALISPGAHPGSSGLQQVPVEQIRPNPQQPRTRVNPETLEELAQSIREHGVLQPVVVARVEGSWDAYQLIAGERRWRAAQLAGLPAIPAVVKDATTSRSNLEVALVENIQRHDLNALEEALAYRQLVDEHGLTQDVVAQRVGKSRVAVSNTLRLLQLPPEVQLALADGAITEGHARAILGAATAEARLALLARVIAEGLNVRQTELLARQAPEPPPDPPERPTPARASADPDVARLENAFRQSLGTKVQLVRQPSGAGRLVIYFFSDDELQGLSERLGAE